MDAWRTLFVTCAALMSVECTQVLQYSPTSVVCSGPCCPGCLKIDVAIEFQKREKLYSCDERKCSFEHLDHTAEYAIDNILQSLWNSSAIYSNIKPVSVGLTMDLGQKRNGIQRIDVLGHGISSMSDLRISSDGVNFDRVDSVVYSEKSNKLEIEPVLGVPQARFIHLQFSDEELPEIAEVYIFASQESGGFCINQLINQLRNITDQIQATFQAFGDNQRLEMLQDLLRYLQDFIVKVERNVPRLQTTLEEKVSMQSMQLLEFDTSQIYKELQDSYSDLQSLLAGSFDYNEAICELEKRIIYVSNQLNSQLNVAMMGITTTKEISTSVNEQSFASDESEIQMHKVAAEMAIIDSNSFSTLMERITDRVNFVSGALERSTINSLDLVATSVQKVTSDSMNKSASLDALLLELQHSQESIELMIVSYNSLMADSALILMKGRTQLSEIGLELMLSSLTFLMSSLDNDIREYQLDISAYNKCSPAVCTLGHMYAETLFQNFSAILNISQTTLQRNRAFVDSLFNLTGPFSYSDIIFSALTVQNISGAAINQLESIGISLLSAQSSVLQQTSIVINNKSLQLLNETNDIQLMLRLLQEKQSTLHSLFDKSSLLAANYSSVREELSIQADQFENTDQLQLDTESVRNLTEISNSRVSSIDIDMIDTIISDISTNTENASKALDTSLINFENTELFINATRRAIGKFSANVSAFVAENIRIIEEIDTIIASLGDIHTRINTINSPVLLSSMEQDNSFISLQPPLDRPLNETIQFESIDLYFWTGPQFRTPTILFYLGPICSVNSCNLSDYFIILLKNGGVINVQWKIGNEIGNDSQPGFQLGFSQLHITRIGASFEIRYGVSVGQLGNPFTYGTVLNDSILFTTSNRTAFLLGGVPNGLQLGVVLKDVYASFEGQIQQVLFNGEQWGLWNIRSASDAVLHGEFQRNELATVNAWHASPTSTAAAISFDGTGYLYVEQLSSISSFSFPFRSMIVTLRPNDESDGLVLFAFDSEINLSMEVFFQAGDLHLLVIRHDNNVTLVNYVQELDSSIKSTRSRELQINFLEGLGFQVNNINFVNRDNAVFFSDLTNVKAWFGGVNESALNMRFAPTGTLAGYFGCVDITVQDDALSNVFEGGHFINQYLNSPVQRGFSATCLQTVYTSEVGFDGTPKAFLAYDFLEPVRPPNSPIGSDQSARNLLTFSFYSQRTEGIILVLQNEDGDELSVVLQDALLKVRIYLPPEDRFILESRKMVKTMEWHDVLLQFRSGVHELYLDGIIQASRQASSNFNLQSMSVPPVNPDQPPAVFVGGIDNTQRSSNNESLPSFTGCIRDMTISYEAYSFLSTSQSLPRYPSGVTYHSCPFLSTTAVRPELPVHPDQPIPNLCVPSPSITNVSLGSFHRQTQLNTSNVIGLLQRSWSLEVVLLYKDDGNVLSIATAEGYLLSLVIQNKIPKLLLMGDELSGPELKENDSIELVIFCSTNSTTVSCILSVNNTRSEAGFIETGTFVPEPPIVLGQAILYDGRQVDSFVGCINSLSVNRDTFGFDGLYTGQPCYNNNVKGIGFSGISLIEKEFMLTVNESLTVAITFKPARANGLIMLLTTENSSKAIFAAGLRNGRIHVSNLNGFNDELQVDICDPNNGTFYTLEVKLENEFITVMSGSSSILPTANINQSITVSIGSAPENLAEEDQLLFLLSDEVNQTGFVPGFIGCISEININGALYSNPNGLGLDKTQDILVGICPL